MPEVEVSDRALLNAFHNRLIQHAREVFSNSVGEELKERGTLEIITVNHFCPSPSEMANANPSAEILMGGMGMAGGGAHPDLYFLASKPHPIRQSFPNLVILIEATSWSWVEVRDEAFMPAAEKFAEVWEKERKLLIPMLEREIAQRMGCEAGNLPGTFKIWRPDNVTIFKAYGEELTSALPAAKKQKKDR